MEHNMKQESRDMTVTEIRVCEIQGPNPRHI